MKFIRFNRDNPEHLSFAARAWSEACGESLAITPGFVSYNTLPSLGYKRGGVIAYYKNRMAGFVLVSTKVTEPEDKQGFIEALAVSPEATGQGIGRMLLSWAEEWLAQHGCNEVIICQGPRPFAPGLPTSAQSLRFFVKQGYKQNNHFPFVWDLARDLLDYNPPYQIKNVKTELRPCHLESERHLLGLLEKDFYDGWLYDYQQFRRDGGDISEYLLFWTSEGAVGFCQVTFEHSVRPIERYYPHGLPHPWGQMGTFGIASAQRGKGYGAILIDSAARHLKNRGVRGCIIDWTGFLDLYGKFGFIPYRQYVQISKSL